ncbi:hypothetical protein BN2537_13019 [Streptomyces venezuelae]|nr:hypothetical protein BN2537_13019 [Streptomyces venezuelae]
MLVAGLDLRRARADPGVRHQPAHVPLLLGQDQGEDAAGLAGAGGAAAAVQVVLVVHRRVDVHDHVEVVDVDAAGRHVRRDERGDLAGLELVQGPVALRLRAAAVQAGGPYTVGEEPLDQPVHGPLGVEEEDRPAVAGRDLQRDGLLVGLVHHVQDVVLHGGHRAGRGVDRVHDRVVQEHLDELVDVPVERGREEQPLAARLDLLEQLGDLRQEAHVGHLVGLVEDRDRHLVEPAVAALDEVHEPAGRGDEDLGAAAQRGGLPGDRHAADDRGDPQTQGAGVRGEGVGDLLRELAGGHQDQREGRGRLGAAAGGAGEEREAEGEGLAGAGAAPAEDVAPGEGVRQGRGLDRERLRHTLLAQNPQEALGHVQVGEGGHRGERGRHRLRRRELAGRRGRRGTAAAAGALRLRRGLRLGAAGAALGAFGAGHACLPGRCSRHSRGPHLHDAGPGCSTRNTRTGPGCFSRNTRYALRMSLPEQ